MIQSMRCQVHIIILIINLLIINYSGTPVWAMTMEHRNLALKFSQLRLPRVTHNNTDRIFRWVFNNHQFYQLIIIWFRFRPNNPNMDQLVHDFNTALDETAGSNSASSRSSASRRKVRKLQHMWLKSSINFTKKS